MPSSRCSVLERNRVFDQVAELKMVETKGVKDASVPVLAAQS